LEAGSDEELREIEDEIGDKPVGGGMSDVERALGNEDIIEEDDDWWYNDSDEDQGY
jgi:hypothetical protein